MFKFIVKRIEKMLYVVDKDSQTAVSGPYTDNYQAADEAGKRNVRFGRKMKRGGQ